MKVRTQRARPCSTSIKSPTDTRQGEPSDQITSHRFRLSPWWHIRLRSSWSVLTRKDLMTISDRFYSLWMRLSAYINSLLCVFVGLGGGQICLMHIHVCKLTKKSGTQRSALKRMLQLDTNTWRVAGSTFVHMRNAFTRMEGREWLTETGSLRGSKGKRVCRGRERERARRWLKKV